MGEAFLVQKYSIVSDTQFAVIAITYPSGSTCTCTNGIVTFSAPDTGGSWLCNISETGTWTVNCTDGTNTKSQSVEITSEGQFESMVLSYQLVLFGDGVLNSDYSLSTTYYISPAIDVSNYSTLEIVGRHCQSPYSANFNACLTTDPSSVTSSNTPASKVTIPYSAAEQTYTIDLSGLSGNMYLGIWFHTSYMKPTLSITDDGKLRAFVDTSTNGSNSYAKFSSIIFK